MTAETTYEPSHVSVRTKISALWTAMLFIFAYVDIFGLYRPKFRAELEAGEIGGFTVNQGFLLGTTLYIVIPSGRRLLRVDLAACHGRSASSRTTVSTRSTSARVVRKFVMHARRAKRPSTVAFDR